MTRSEAKGDPPDLPPHRPAPPFALRRARPQDEAALSCLLTASYGCLLRPDYRASVLSEAVRVIGRARPELLSAPGYFVAEDGGGRLIAAGGWTWSGPAGGVSPMDWGHMRHVAVLPQFAGRGIGRVLLAHALADAQGAGVRVVSCLSTLTARRFYAASGFSDQGEVALALAPGLSFPAVQMRKVLN